MKRNVIYYGSPRDLPDSITVRAGPCSAVFEPASGFLRYLSAGSEEILRGIYAAVRNRNWDTIPPQIRNLEVMQQENGFEITFLATCRRGEIDFDWQGRITGEESGNITYQFDGEARSTFQRNRIGFCILHPAALRGRPVRVQTVDGVSIEGSFPYFISPHQPFKNIKSITHEVIPGLKAEVRMVGDVFEMEDQRNWTDASYKTYCTPLERPFPVEVAKGTRISQKVGLLLHRDPEIAKSPAAPEVSAAMPTLTLDEEAALGRLTQIGLQFAQDEGDLGEKELARVKALRLSHLRVDLHLSDARFESILRRASDQAKRIAAPLEVAVFLTDRADREVEALLGVLERNPCEIVRWLVFHADEKSTRGRWITLFRRKLEAHRTSGRVAAGTNAFFAELNRERPNPRLVDEVCYSINPQVHAFDNASMVENLDAQGMSVESCREFSAGKPVAVSPVTLKMRSNPNATGPEPEPEAGELPSQVDVRQMSLFGAGWTLGSIKHLSEAGTNSVTFYETVGWRGVQELPEGSPLPRRFRSIPGSVYPLYFVLADVGEFRDAKIALCQSSQPLKVEGLLLEQDGRRRLLIANYSAQGQTVRIENLNAAQVAVRTLDENSAEDAMKEPESFHEGQGRLEHVADKRLELRIHPCGVIRIDF